MLCKLLIFSSVLCPKTFSVFVTNEIKYLNILFLVYLIFHLYIFQCAFFAILNDLFIIPNFNICFKSNKILDYCKNLMT